MSSTSLLSEQSLTDHIMQADDAIRRWRKDDRIATAAACRGSLNYEPANLTRLILCRENFTATPRICQLGIEISKCVTDRL